MPPIPKRPKTSHQRPKTSHDIVAVVYDSSEIVHLPKKNEEYRALSLKQPAASAIAEGYKDVENRGRPVTPKGAGRTMWLYLAASATGYKDSEVFAAAMPESKRWREIHAAKPPDGVIVGMAAFNGYESTTVCKSGWNTGPVCHKILASIEFAREDFVEAKGTITPMLWLPAKLNGDAITARLRASTENAIAAGRVHLHGDAMVVYEK